MWFGWLGLDVLASRKREARGPPQGLSGSRLLPAALPPLAIKLQRTRRDGNGGGWWGTGVQERCRRLQEDISCSPGAYRTVATAAGLLRGIGKGREKGRGKGCKGSGPVRQPRSSAGKW